MASKSYKEDHQSYMDGSEAYAFYFGAYGKTMPRTMGERIAAEHGTSLLELQESGGLAVKRDGAVPTLGLFMALGY